MLNDENKPTLMAVYESMYSPVNSHAKILKENTEESSEDEGDEQEKPVKTKKKKLSPGQMYNDSTSYFNHIMKQLNEEYGMEDEGDEGETFEFEGDDEDVDVSGDAESVLRSIFDQLKSYFGEGDSGVVDTDDSANIFDDDALEDGDSIPSESVEHGDQGTYDGKAKKQKPTDLIKPNGDAQISKSQVTGFKPNKKDGGNAKHHGAQGNYDGKAKKQGATDLIKPNGDAQISKSQKTGYGKAEKEDLF